MPKTIQFRTRVFIAFAIGLLAIILPMLVVAAQITSRKFTLSNSNGGSVSDYDFDSAALPTTGTPVRSVKAEACTTASGSCTTPTGFSAASANLTAQPSGLGTTDWTDDSNAGNLRITRASSGTNPSGVVRIDWDTVTNPTADNTTYFLRVTTYSDAAYATPIDTGTVAVSTAEQITVTASVDETLTFCVGTSGITTTSCAGATGSTVALGTLSPSTTGSGVSQFGVTTNAQSGYSVTINGTTLTSGGDTISALAVQTVSTQGVEQFGVNLRDNTTPDVGVEPDGAGDATPTANYNTVDQFRFVTADSIASDAEEDAFRRFHVAYIANIAGDTESGSYQTILTYICTATF